MFELLIRNALVYDGTGSEPFHSDVLLDQGKIAAMGPHLSQHAEREIDAAGLALSPGFIDSHSHNDVLAEEFPECIAEAEQGITTQVAGMCGISAAPMSRQYLQDGLRVVGALKEVPPGTDLEKRFSFGDYLAFIDRPLGTNMAFLVGHGSLRAAVMGFSDKKPTVPEMQAMKDLLACCMEQGAYGISFGLIYPPGIYSDTDEMAELCKVVAAYGGVMTVHMRSEAANIVPAVKEMLTVVRKSGVRCVISHHKVTGGPKNWGKTKETIALMEQAIREGYDVFCDQYPYTASSTGLYTYLPDDIHTLGTEKILALLADPQERAALKKRILGDRTDHQCFINTMIGASEAHPELSGKMLNAAADDLGKTPFDLLCDLLIDDKLFTNGIFHTMCEEDLLRVFRWRRAMIGTDGLWYPGCSGTHPRSIGTFPRVLGKYVREEHANSLPEVIRKITSLPAQVYGLPGKGILAPGFDADLVLFDPDTILDQADYHDFRKRCLGLRYVIIGGKIVVENAVFNGQCSGHVLRKV